ncbi:hypothetical protein [[Mycoplasma] phocae]|uniref:hypothetical protein n=1 Tax=[Mycoplasma] phocae TaxID=142651 RepID=UPI0014735727|nr:hypothetical protein [[Mycoplasma] phocae]
MINYNSTDNRNPRFAERKNVHLANELFIIINGSINNKISLTQEQISEINELVKNIKP